MNAMPSSQLGRSALLAHGLMWLAVGVSVGLAFWLKPSTELLTCLGVAAAAVLVFGAWSLVLAIRALRARERPFWPVAVLAAGLFEVALYCALLRIAVSDFSPLDWAYRYGLPVFVPVFALATFAAAPIAVWRSRKAENRDTATGGDAWPRGRRWKRGLAWFVPLMLLIVALVLPAPLFLFALHLQRYSWSNSVSQKSWHQFVLQNTPLFIADGVAEMYACSTKQRDIEIYGIALMNGRVATARLSAELQSTNAYVQCGALDGLYKHNPAAALEFAEKMGMQSLTPGAVSSQMEFVAARMIADYGTAAQIQRLLATAENMPAPNTSFTLLIRSLGWTKRVEFLPTLEKILNTNTVYRLDLLGALATLAPEKDVERIWLKGLDDPVAARVSEVIDMASHINSTGLRQRILLAAMNHARPHARLAAMTYFTANLAELMDITLKREFAKRLVQLLDDSELNVRRAATVNVASMLGRPGPPSPASGTPESAAEKDEREALKSAALKWLSGR